ncbi:predicted protein [Botrytis cinerea T4]|uniref:Uncharacterized protein n=1 Tax=Botryotinia fuckeliana (strain T4) TaxID=999810 RepID=G2YBB7_BOTF4|nr:predicted protein [Botrytis cinerea T4]
MLSRQTVNGIDDTVGYRQLVDGLWRWRLTKEQLLKTINCIIRLKQMVQRGRQPFIDDRGEE